MNIQAEYELILTPAEIVEDDRETGTAAPDRSVTYETRRRS